MRRLLILAMGMLAALPAGAQLVGQNASPDGNGGYTISVRSQLVVEAVTVKDKKGGTVKGLTAKDFHLTEDGVDQKISFAEYQELPTAKDAVPLGPPTQEDLKLYNKLNGTQITAEKQGETKYKDRRLMALYFDMTAMPPMDQQRALTAAMDFIRKQMTTVDRVAILRFQGASVDVLQDFTDDRNKLLSILSTMSVGEGQGNDEETSDASSADTGAAFGQDNGEFNIFNTDRQLSALQTAAQMLGQLNEKKELIYFASNLVLNGINNQAQLHATIDAAIRAGVSFWPIDARGLVATAPLGDASRGSPGGAAMYNGTSALAAISNFQKSQDTLYGLAADTGGKALFDNNDLTRGIVQAQDSITSYYILGYYPTNMNLDGKFRRIKISVDPTVADLDYRQGYYAGKVFAKFTTADKERQLEEAFMLGDPMTELTIELEMNYFQLNHAEYFVPMEVKIPGRELALAKQHGAEHTLIDFLYEVKDDYGNTTVTNARDNVNIPLSEATAQELVNRPVTYDAGFTLLPGKYTIKFLARDDETGRIGTYQASFTVPNLDKVTDRLPTSSVVLSSQKVDWKNDALYNAAKSKDAQKAADASPLVQDGLKMIPSVTRVFSKQKPMYLYLQAYEHQTATTQPVVAFVSFYRDGKKVYETPPVEQDHTTKPELQTMPISFTVPLTELANGQYDCQVTVLDPSGQKAAFWDAPVMVVQ